MDAHEVNIKIAKALGYDWKREENAVAWYKDGSLIFGFSVYDSMTDAEIWGALFGYEGTIGDWSTDVAAAIELVSDNSYWQVSQDSKDSWASAQVEYPSGYRSAMADTPAMALCLAWLKGQE